MTKKVLILICILFSIKFLLSLSYIEIPHDYFVIAFILISIFINYYGGGNYFNILFYFSAFLHFTNSFYLGKFKAYIMNDTNCSTVPNNVEFVTCNVMYIAGVIGSI